MPAEPHALSTVPPPEPPAAADYDAICSAVTATARGRWFLDEFAKRNRNSDTAQVLAAIAEMKAAVVDERVQQASREAHQAVRIELLEMARTIAQTRAEVAESRPAPTQPSAAPPGAAPAGDVAAAAERLRQIAWTIRACGIELPAAEQIGEIANAILSADALRGLGEQRAHKLTEALHYLEHRIERMLDGHRAATNDDAPVAEAPKAEDRAPAPVTAAVAMIAAALRPDAAQTDTAETGAAEADTAETGAAAEPASSPATAEAAATTMARGALAASDAGEYPMDNDVVLTVAADAIEPPEAPVPAAPADAAAGPAKRAELEFEPLTPAKPPTAENNEAEFTGLELEPLAVVPPVAVAPAAEARPAVDAAPDAPAAGDAEAPPAQPAAATAEPAAEPEDPDSGANDNLPMMLAAQAGTTTGTDAIAMQVDQDLDGLTDPVPDETIAAAAPQPVVAPAAAQIATGSNAAEPSHELSPHQARVSAAVAGAQAARAQLSDTLAAIESELFGSTRPDAHAGSAPPTAIPAAKPAASPVPTGPLAALMAMSEEERIALFS